MKYLSFIQVLDSVPMHFFEPTHYLSAHYRELVRNIVRRAEELEQNYLTVFAVSLAVTAFVNAVNKELDAIGSI